VSDVWRDCSLAVTNWAIVLLVVTTRMFMLTGKSSFNGPTNATVTFAGSVVVQPGGGLIVKVYLVFV